MRRLLRALPGWYSTNAGGSSGYLVVGPMMSFNAHTHAGAQKEEGHYVGAYKEEGLAKLCRPRASFAQHARGRWAPHAASEQRCLALAWPNAGG